MLVFYSAFCIPDTNYSVSGACHMLRTAVPVVSLHVINFRVKWTASTAEVTCKVAKACWVF